MEISISLDPAVDGNLENYLTKVNTSRAGSIHADVMRRDFVCRDAMTPAQFKTVMANAQKPVDVHLMLRDVGEISAVADVPTMPRSITFHAEAAPNAMVAGMILNAIKKQKIMAGIAIDLNTPVNCVACNLIKKSDIVTIMSVVAGKSGQTFNAHVLSKVAEIKKINPAAKIIMDGGINKSNIAAVRAAGVDIAVVGSYVYNSADIGAAIAELVTTAGL